MDEHDIIDTYLELELSQGFKENHGLNVADSSSNLNTSINK
jgi:hypothetical protein